jgi:hypothetical protein
MATAHEKLASSLQALKALQDGGHRAIASKALSRTHRERLVHAGFLEEVIKGWYLPTRPGEQVGSIAAWFAGMRDFVAGYCTERFQDAWHLSPEQSLLLLSGERSLPRQLQIWAPEGNNQVVELLHGCSLFLYRARAALPSDASEEDKSLRLVHLPAALVAVGPSFFTQNPMAARIALGMVDDPTALLERLLAGSHSTIAGRLPHARQRCDRRYLGRHDAQRRPYRAADVTVRPTSGAIAGGAAGVALRPAAPTDLGPAAPAGARCFQGRPAPSLAVTGRRQAGGAGG